jgi:hypothetical protein
VGTASSSVEEHSRLSTEYSVGILMGNSIGLLGK